jgi:hypothetical protein
LSAILLMSFCRVQIAEGDAFECYFLRGIPLSVIQPNVDVPSCFVDQETFLSCWSHAIMLQGTLSDR